MALIPDNYAVTVNLDEPTKKYINTVLLYLCAFILAMFLSMAVKYK